MLNAKVLIVSDEAEPAQIWAHALGRKGLDAVVVASANEAMDSWTNEVFDLTIIDIYTERLEGFDLCRLLRAEAMVVNPILLLTYSSGELEILKAYDSGVDECIAKPVGPKVFLAKVMAWLRRSWMVPAESVESLHVGDLELDPTRRQVVTVNGSVARLTNLEFRLLHLLMSRPGQVLESDLIIDRVWGYVGAGNGTLLKNVVYRLRRKIETEPSQPRYLHTMPGEGYMLRTG